MIAREVAHLITSLPEYKEARRIGVYLSMPTAEISTKAIVMHALQEKKTIFIPYVYKHKQSDLSGLKSAMDMVSLHSFEDYESFRPDPWGIPIPNEETLERRYFVLGEKETSHGNARGAREEDLELIIMPGVAFDRKLSRLGHGKGFYDSFLQRYQRLHIGEKNASTQKNMPFLGKVLIRDKHAVKGI